MRTTADVHEIHLAVRQGRAVEKPELRLSAIALARRRKRNQILWAILGPLLMLFLQVWVQALIRRTGLEQAWQQVLAQDMTGFLILLVPTTGALIWYRRFARSERANRHLQERST